MSDARNSSGNIRGGGARLTGGAGRTQKDAGTGGNRKGGGLPGLTSQLPDKKELARRNLQLLTMSKKLAIEAKRVCLENHTEEEYIKLNVPIPDPESALKKLRAMTKFTDDWYDADFRERWLQTVADVWNAELKAEFEAAAKAAAANVAAKEKWENEKKMKESGENSNNNVEGVPVSTEELEAMIQDMNLSAEERKKAKKKLKKRKQKANKKNADVGDKVSDDKD